MINICISLLLASFAFSETPDPVVIIANKSVPLTEMRTKELVRVYSMQQQRWADGSKVVLFNLKSGDVLKDRFFHFLGMKPIDLRKIWLRMQLTGEGKAPTAVETQNDMLKRVAAVPGAIGYVSTSKVDNSVKIISIIEN